MQKVDLNLFNYLINHLIKYNRSIKYIIIYVLLCVIYLQCSNLNVEERNRLKRFVKSRQLIYRSRLVKFLTLKIRVLQRESCLMFQLLRYRSTPLSAEIPNNRRMYYFLVAYFI